MAPTAEELEMAKSETLNSFVFNFASTATQLQRIMVYALLGIPEASPRSPDPCKSASSEISGLSEEHDIAWTIQGMTQ